MYLVMETGHHPSEEFPGNVMILGLFDDDPWSGEGPSIETFRRSVARNGGQQDWRDMMGGLVWACPNGVTVCLRYLGRVMRDPAGVPGLEFALSEDDTNA